MNNKKGFTLIEILISTLIIGLLIALTASSFVNVGERTRKKSLTKQIEGIESAAAQWGISHYDAATWTNEICEVKESTGMVNVPCEKFTLTVQKLIDDKEYKPNDDGEVINPVTKASMNGEQVKVIKQYGSFYGDYLNK